MLRKKQEQLYDAYRKNQKGLILLDITEAVILSPLKILNSIYLKSLYYPFQVFALRIRH